MLGATDEILGGSSGCMHAFRESASIAIEASFSLACRMPGGGALGRYQVEQRDSGHHHESEC
ncbi:MAG: hypothetical protein ACJ8EF_01405, partial [Bradyrhizobium sp.]